MTYVGAVPLPLGRQVMPFGKFPEQKQREIADAVAQPRPPARSIGLYLAQIPSRAWYEWYWSRGIDPDACPPRSRIPRWLRDFIIERDGLLCGICGLAVPADDVHIDHVYPRALGGSDEADNLQVAHSRCNMRKGAKV